MKPYDDVIRKCEECLAEHGDNARGVGWPRGDAETRYRVMLELLRPGEGAVSVLDFGCGLSHLYEYIRARRLDRIQYTGLDLSDRFLAISRRKFPSVPFLKLDVLDESGPVLPEFDYIILNGIFNYRGALSNDAMFDYLRTLVRRVFERARVGIAFNVMSKQVDWEREDLFHLPCDPLATFLSREVSRHFTIRHDYGLYEYTTYVYRVPSAPEQSGAKRLVDEKKPE
jgi:SAM-dependent methyltransferase